MSKAEYSPKTMVNQTCFDSAKDLIRFIDVSPTPYHAVTEVARRLQAKGFQELDEREHWSIAPGDRRYVIRSGGTIAAWIMGSAPPTENGFMIIGAHTDSPGFRIKPAPDHQSGGHQQVAVELYGGLLLATWLDRDLSIAGRVVTLGGQSYLVKFPRPIGRIPNLAIHLNRKANSEGLKIHAQNQVNPTLGLTLHNSEKPLTELITDELSRTEQADLDPDQIAGYDLALFDVQGAALGGLNQEFVYSARLDNLASCHAATEALLNSDSSSSVTRVIALYDHEEIGSQSDAGAQSRFLLSVLDRLTKGFPATPSADFDRALAHSLLISADMAHAVHPNYTEKHDAQHWPKLGLGPVIKINANRSYATDGPSMAAFESACRAVNLTAQRFVSRNDMPCGGTIGSISAARMGIRTVDVGNPMLSMHSCREMAGTHDVEKMIRVFTYLFENGHIPPPAV